MDLKPTAEVGRRINWLSEDGDVEGGFGATLWRVWASAAEGTRELDLWML